jgi:hypothetical protein
MRFAGFPATRDPSPQMQTESCHFFETYPTSVICLPLVSCNVG